MTDALRFDYDRMVGESYKDYAARMAGQARAAEIDRDRHAAAIQRVRALCAEYMAEAEGGGYTNVDTLWPTDVLAALDGTDPP